MALEAVSLCEAIRTPRVSPAEQMLAGVLSDGAALLCRLSRDAVRRMLAEPYLRGREFFAPAEREELANEMAAAVATADMLARSLVADHGERVRARKGIRESFDPSEKRDESGQWTVGGGAAVADHEPSALHAFLEGELHEGIFSSIASYFGWRNPVRPPPAQTHAPAPKRAPLRAVEPQTALDFFRSLVPILGRVDVALLPNYQRVGFTLVLATDQQMLERVQGIIAERLKTGELSTGAAAIQAVLDEAGVTPRNPQYADAVFRTNAMSAFNAGTHAQMMADRETFPVWRLSNPADRRSRPAHKKRNGNYYPVGITLEQVTGTDAANRINCRCVPVPVDKWTWQEKLKAGAALSLVGYDMREGLLREEFDPSEKRDESGKWTSGGGGAKTAEPSPHHETAAKWTEKSSLPSEAKTQYAAHMAAVLEKMPAGCRKAAHEAIAEYGGGVTFYESVEAVTAACEKASGKKERSKVGGFVQYAAGGDSAKVHLDGGPDAEGIYAHEMGHAVDVGNKYSDDPKWQSAWKAEIKGGRKVLSRYAMTSAAEGFAELHRCICTDGLEAARAGWPKCCKYLESKGLL